MAAQLSSRRGPLTSPRASGTNTMLANEKSRAPAALPVRSINHVSRIVKDVKKSVSFYRDVLGFVEVKRPRCFNFEGAWFYNYNIGIHLIEGNPTPKPSKINVKSEHWSFQCDSLSEVEQRLRDHGVEYITDILIDGDIRISQIFFHDPDNNMIEICNCEVMPLVPVHHPMLEDDMMPFSFRHADTADNNRPARAAMPLSSHSQNPGGLLTDGLGKQ